MCRACEELSLKIRRYRRINAQAFDPLTTDRIASLICELELERETAAAACAAGVVLN
jgi:hypothetical protein